MHQDLSPGWARFIEELSQSSYLDFIREFLGEVRVRYAWHRGFRGSEVSPHRDGPDKLGTHIFYFHTPEEWDPAWGGNTLVLSGKSVASESPDFREFSSSESIACFDNHSFLFQNAPDAWHGVEAVTCPEGTHRKLFNVIFEKPEKEHPPKSSKLVERAKNWLRGNKNS